MRRFAILSLASRPAMWAVVLTAARLSTVVCVALGTTTLCEVRAFAQTSYKFINIADTSGPFSEFGSGPFSNFVNVEINTHGDVAFSAKLDSGGEGVFKGRGGQITTIADDAGQFRDFLDGDVSINDADVVAFSAWLDTGVMGIFTGVGGLPTTIADSTGPILFFTGVALNNRGEVAFGGQLSSHDEGIFKASAGGIHTVRWLNRDPDEIGTPAINDHGQVAYWDETWVDLHGHKRGIYVNTDSAQSPIPIVEGSSVVDRRPRMNKSSVVAYALSSPSTQGLAIYTSDGSSTTLIADSAGPFNQLLLSPDINDTGEVVFGARSIAAAPGFIWEPILWRTRSSREATHCLALHL